MCLRGNKKISHLNAKDISFKGGHITLTLEARHCNSTTTWNHKFSSMGSTRKHALVTVDLITSVHNPYERQVKHCDLIQSLEDKLLIFLWHTSIHTITAKSWRWRLQWRWQHEKNCQQYYICLPDHGLYIVISSAVSSSQYLYLFFLFNCETDGQSPAFSICDGGATAVCVGGAAEGSKNSGHDNGGGEGGCWWPLDRARSRTFDMYAWGEVIVDPTPSFPRELMRAVTAGFWRICVVFLCSLF